MNILVLNAGSSTLKCAVIDPATGFVTWRGVAERLGTAEAGLTWSCSPNSAEHHAVPLDDASIPGACAVIAALLTDVAYAQIAAIGHRVVHGGCHFFASARIDDAVVSGISACIPLAPLHNPANLAGISTTRRLFPHLPQVAVFDTAFHQTMPEVAFRYAVPSHWYDRHNVRRYGFHGTSHRFVAQEAARRLGRPVDDVRLVTAHLGNGCSACAIRGGRSIDTTMGMTPLEGLVMGTRSGDIDPGMFAHLIRHAGIDAEAVTHSLNHDSGLLGLSGLSNDMRTLSAAADAGHEGARLAIAIFCYRLAKAIAALTVPLGGLDALVFTGGIGEHSIEVRSRTLSYLAFLGLVEDKRLNLHHGRLAEGRITAPSAACALVVPTDEELAIARDTASLVSRSPA